MITPEELSKIFSYDSNTGQIIRITGRKAGMPSGSDRVSARDAYRIINVKGKFLYAHRIAWSLMTGLNPESQIDHIDGNGLNNAWNNLRMLNQAQNMKNTRRRKKEPWTISGVRPRNGAYIVTIGSSRIGSFRCIFEAICCRKSAELRMGYLPEHGKRPAL